MLCEVNQVDPFVLQKRYAISNLALEESLGCHLRRTCSIGLRICRVFFTGVMIHASLKAKVYVDMNDFKAPYLINAQGVQGGFPDPWG